MQDRHIELLTAFIDGELTRRERIAVLRLLNQSSEARSMLWQLQQNSLVFKQLPVKTLPADFSTKIVDIISRTAAAPAPPPTPVQPARPAGSRFGASAAVRLAWAAGLLLAVAGGMFYILRDNKEPQIAKHDPPPPVVDPPPKERKVDPPTPPKVEPKETPKPFDGRFVFAELRQRPQQDLLEKELTRAKSVRVDLYVKNNSQALDRLGRKLQFQAAAKKNKEKEHRLFVENLTPADVVKFLAELAREDKGVFRNLHIQPMSGGDQKLLCALLGIEQAELHYPVERTKLPNIIEAKDKKDPPPPSTKTKTPERRAVLLTREDSDQIRNFVDQRRQLKAGTVQILFVVHTAA